MAIQESIYYRGALAVIKKVRLQRKFRDRWQEDMYRSQLRFLPEPPPDDYQGVYRAGYWSVVWVPRGQDLQALRRHRYTVPLWVSENDHFCFAIPSILLSCTANSL